MSCFAIYYKDGKKMMRPIHKRKEYLSFRDSNQQKSVMKSVHSGNESQKNKLIEMSYSCLPNEDGSLKGSTRMSTTVGMDIDHIPEDQMQEVGEHILSMRDEVGLLMLERSARGRGYHLVFRRHTDLSQEDNLRWASNLLGVEYDRGAKDITRVFFTTTASEEDLLYLDDEIFTIEEAKVDTASNLSPQTSDTKPQDLSLSPQTSDTKPQNPSLSPVTERTRYIVRGVMKEKDLRESDFLEEGGRHTSVKMLLSGATQLLKKEEMNGMLQELMPDHWNDQNIQQLVNDFYQNYANPNQRLFKYQEQLFTGSRRLERSEDCSTEQDLPPKMPKRLPSLVRLLVSKTPSIYKEAVAHAAFPALATHLRQVRFRYTDNVEHEATLMNCLMAGTGAGKSCIDKPIEHIMADIMRRDEENLRREADWKKDCKKKGANKDKLPRPEGLVIQTIDPDMTMPALMLRMHEADGHFVYVKLNELDLFEQLKGAKDQHFQLMCLAFDPGATIGQTRVGTDSVTARAECRFNWNACTTIQKGRRFFRKASIDGPISRINFCTIPEQEIGSPQPIYGQYDAAFDEALKPYIDRLVGARGLIKCPQAYKLAKKLQQECADFASLSQSKTYWNLSHRACVIAWLKACVLYVANGEKWENEIDDFIRWSLNYDLWCKMQFFGADIERANNGEDARIGTRGPQNLLELLPDEFTIEDVKRVRQEQGMSEKGTKKMVSQWKTRHYILQLTVDSFKKANKYRKCA